jgi:HTH-type transcriptional regulator/antitoxin HigA
MTDVPFNLDTYHRLLLEVSPRPITSEEEYDRLLAIAEKYTFSKDKTPEERAVYKVVVLLIEDYESEHYPMDRPAPYLVLQHCMESKGIRQKDLVPVLGSSALVSRIVRGKANISIRVARLLGDYFAVCPSLFI